NSQPLPVIQRERSELDSEQLISMAIAKVTTDILGATGLPGASVHYFTIAGTTATTAEATDVCARVRAFWNGLAAYLAVGIQCVVDPTVDALDVPSGALQGRTTGTTP